MCWEQTESAAAESFRQKYPVYRVISTALSKAASFETNLATGNWIAKHRKVRGSSKNVLQELLLSDESNCLLSGLNKIWKCLK